MFLHAIPLLFLVFGSAIHELLAFESDIPRIGTYKIILEDSLTNCASVNPTAILITGTLEPAEIPIPGEAFVIADVVFTKPLPDDLQLRLDLTKLPNVKVPCFPLPDGGGIGSCAYDICELISFPALCNALLPPELKCTCPLAAGVFTLPRIKLSVPNLGALIGGLMTGSYLGQAIMYSKANPDWTVGCLEFRFRLKL